MYTHAYGVPTLRFGVRSESKEITHVNYSITPIGKNALQGFVSPQQ